MLLLGGLCRAMRPARRLRCGRTTPRAARPFARATFLPLRRTCLALLFAPAPPPTRRSPTLTRRTARAASQLTPTCRGNRALAWTSLQRAARRSPSPRLARRSAAAARLLSVSSLALPWRLLQSGACRRLRVSSECAPPSQRVGAFQRATRRYGRLEPHRA